MSNCHSDEINRPTETISASESAVGMSPYATGGGGVTFERKVAVQYLAHFLVGDGAVELGDGLRVVGVAFQQAPDYPVDDLVVAAGRPEERDPSLLLALGVRRKPNLVLSDESTQKLIRDFVHAVINAPAGGPEHRLGLVVAGPQQHAEHLSELASIAADQMDAPGFFALVGTPNKFSAGLRRRLDHLEKLVARALQDLGMAEPGTVLVRQHTWQLLSRLTVLMPRLESPDETDWSAVENSLIPVARTSDLAGASRLRDRLVALASEYSPKSARVDLTMLRRDAYEALDPQVRRHQRGWQVLDHLHNRALNSVRDEITASDGVRRMRLDRSSTANELIAIAADSAAIIVSGESGVGKSAIALRSLSAARREDSETVQALCINLRQVPKLTVEFEAVLGCPLSTLLCELSAPHRVLIVDAADAIAEGMEDAFRYLVDAAIESDLNIIAVTAVDSIQVVRDILNDRFSTGVTEYTVPPLTDAEIQDITETFTELRNLYTNPRSRELLRRLIVVDLLVRGGLTGVPLSDADAMQEVWSGLVRRRGSSDRGEPVAREVVLLRLADLALNGGDRLDAIGALDAAAITGLRQDGLLQESVENQFLIGPDFAHDEVRRYAIARLLLAEQDPTSRLLKAAAPRWALAAAQLACQALLQEPDRANTPLRDRFGALQASFDALVEAGHGVRWGDVPSEALLKLAEPSIVLRDAWPGLRADDAFGVQRLARLVDQRLRGDNGIINPIAIEPIISLLLEDSAPWRSGKYATDLLREWLHGHVVARTHPGHPLRILLRERLVEACAEADRRLGEQRRAEAAARAARTPEEIERERRFEESHSDLFVSQIAYGRRRRRQRPEVPRECRDEVFLELLALLGPDLGDQGEAILLRVVQDSPSSLAPALEELFTDVALASYRRGLLAQLTQAYYLDDEADGSAYDDDGIRRHLYRRTGPFRPLAAWHHGPFMALFQSDFRRGVRVLNLMLNHAALIRARTLARLDSMRHGLQDLDISPYQVGLEVTGTRRTYVGDEQVWYWYRGTGVGPYPCISALQALERTCDQLIKQGIPIANLIVMLLEGCENLAIVGLIAGMLVRHMEIADNLLDPYFVDPLIWRLEFRRVGKELSTMAASSEGIEAPDRRNWSLREAATIMTARANDERAAELRRIGETLVDNARLIAGQEREADAIEAQPNGDEHIDPELATFILWASCLDRDKFQVHETPDGLYVQPTPPPEAVQKLQEHDAGRERTAEEMRLANHYFYKPNGVYIEAIETDGLVADIASARELLEDPPPFRIHHPWDVPALVAATALEAHLLGHVDLPDNALIFVAETVLRVSEGAASPRPYELEETYAQEGADRSAARALPLLLMPVAANLRAIVDGLDGSAAFERVSAAGFNLAQSVVNEVRLHLARGLDHLWATPCVQEGPCHHQVGWEIATATMRDCALGGWNRDTGVRSVIALDEPLAKSLADTPSGSIQPSRLDASIRALSPAATANICVSTEAGILIMALLDAQRRSLLSHEHDDMDHRGTHSLVSARALLTLAQGGGDTAIYEQINAYADNSALLGTLLRALSAAAEETPDRAAAARRIWPSVIRHILDLHDVGHTPFQGEFYGDMALAALMPNAAPETEYLYRELREQPIAWWDPFALQPDVEAWLATAAGNAICVDQLIEFLRKLTEEDQARVGIPWVATLVLANPGNIAKRSFLLANWLIETRDAANAAGLSAEWQEIVDALVVEGVARLARYSE